MMAELFKNFAEISTRTDSLGRAKILRYFSVIVFLDKNEDPERKCSSRGACRVALK